MNGSQVYQTFMLTFFLTLLASVTVAEESVFIVPSAPTDENDLRGICTQPAPVGLQYTYEWLVNGKTAGKGKLPSVTAIRCENTEELKAAGATNVKAIPIVEGRHGRAAYISEDHPLVLPAERHMDQREGGVSFWFRPKWRGDDGLRHPLFFASGGPNGLKFLIEKEPEPHQGLVFSISEPDGRRHAVWTSGRSLTPDRWYHIACFWQLRAENSESCRMLMFFNRSLVSDSPRTPEAIEPGEPPNKIIFGSSPAGGPGEVIIDEIRFFDSLPHNWGPPTSPDDPGAQVDTVLPCTAFNSGDEVTFIVSSPQGIVGRAGVKIAKATGERDVFGGLRAITGIKTGVFHTEKIGGIWWIITPKGNAFYAVGTDHVKYTGHWCQKLNYSPYHRNVEGKYGDEESWAKSTLERMKAWNFNLLAAGHSPSLRHRGLAHTEFLSLGAGYAAKDDIVPKTTWTGFPNVFSEGFEKYCDKICAVRCAPNANDPWLFGYFIDNELEWYGKSHRESGLFEEAMKKPAYHPAKRALIQFLEGRYKKISDFNNAWATALRNFEELGEVTQPLTAASPRALADQKAFVRLVAEKYFAITTAAIRKYDPRHMILGCRFAGRAPDIWDICGKYCDIVTLNYYGRVNLETEEAIGVEKLFAHWQKAAGKPLMITEWSFPALDSGLPCMHGAGQRFDTQAQRAHAFDIYQRTFFRLPFMVGSNYFMWVDEPTLGISDTFPEDSNYGLVNEKDEPYPELTAKARSLNAQVHEIHSGRAARLNSSLKVKGNTLEVSVKNSGGLPAKTQVAVWVDGEHSLHPIEVGPGKTVRLYVESQRLAAPGGHLCQCLVDPEGVLPQADRRGCRAALVAFTKPKAKPIAYLVISNPTDETFRGTPVTVRLDQIIPEWARIGRPLDELCVEDIGGRPVPYQVDVLSKGFPFPTPILSAFPMEAELSILTSVSPHSCQTVAVLFKSPPPPKPASTVEVKTDGLAFTVDNGVLRLERGKTGGKFVDKVSFQGVELGELRPLIWQQVDGRDYWAGVDTVEHVHILQGPVRALIEIVAALKTQEPPSYRCKYRLAVYPNQPFFTSQLVSVENTSPKPWTLRSYYHYATSNIGGSREGDEPALKVPNYYLNLGVWGDERVGAYYGVIPPAVEGCSAHFWTDKGAPLSQHADARRELDLLLLPNLRHEASEPAFIIFGAKKGAAGAPWAPLTAHLRAREQLGLQIHKPGWFW